MLNEEMSYRKHGEILFVRRESHLLKADISEEQRKDNSRWLACGKSKI